MHLKIKSGTKKQDTPTREIAGQFRTLQLLRAERSFSIPVAGLDAAKIIF